MKSSIRHGGVLCCDMVFVDAEKNFKNECDERFVTYSVASLVRAQAANTDWARVKVKLVKWPGNPPAGDNKKVDLCPKHSALVMSADEYKKVKEAAKAKKEAERAAARLAAKVAKPKKPRAPRKKKAAAEATA